MGSTEDKAGGMANQVVGGVGQAIGSGTGSDDLVADKIAQETRGDAQRARGDVVLAADGASDDAREARIRSKAYQIWEEERRPDGREKRHWEQARNEVDKTAI